MEYTSWGTFILNLHGTGDLCEIDEFKFIQTLDENKTEFQLDFLYDIIKSKQLFNADLNNLKNLPLELKNKLNNITNKDLSEYIKCLQKKNDIIIKLQTYYNKDYKDEYKYEYHFDLIKLFHKFNTLPNQIKINMDLLQDNNEYTKAYNQLQINMDLLQNIEDYLNLSRDEYNAKKAVVDHIKKQNDAFEKIYNHTNSRIEGEKRYSTFKMPIPLITPRFNKLIEDEKEEKKQLQNMELEYEKLKIEEDKYYENITKLNNLKKNNTKSILDDYNIVKKYEVKFNTTSNLIKKFEKKYIIDSSTDEILKLLDSKENHFKSTEFPHDID